MISIFAALCAACAFVCAHSAEILGAAYALLNLANAIAKGPEAKSALAKIADFLAFLTRAEAAGTLKAPGFMSKAASSDAPAPKSPPDLKALVLLPIAFLAFLPGCAFCKDAANASAARCVLQSSMISCGEADGFALLPVVLGLIADAIAGQPFDAGALEMQLVQQGVKDVPCVLAALEQFVETEVKAKDPANPLGGLLQYEAHEALAASLAKRGMHGHMTIRLKSGKPIDVDVK